MSTTTPVAGPETDELQRLKTEFLISLNQEIRTPLSSILGLTELLSGTRLNEEQRHYLKGTQVCAEQLLETLSNALEYTALSAGTLELEESEFPLRETLEGAAHKELPKVQAKRLRLVTALDGRLPLLVVGDAVRLEQAVRHLLRNAVEFTREGEVELVAGGSPDGRDRFLLRVEVRDTGAGIAPEQLGLIFQPFRQLEGGLARSHLGLGLGLALVDKLVRLMGGHITARSEPGRGSAIEFRVPVRIPFAVRDHRPP